MHLFRILLVALTFAVTPVSNALTIPFSYSFTASNLGGPVETISGSFSGTRTPQASSDLDLVDLTSIDLTIAGHSYSLSDIGLTAFSLAGARLFDLYGRQNDKGVGSFTNDFLLSFVVYNDDIYPWRFVYTTPTSLIFFDAYADIGAYRISANVPDDATSLTLLPLALFGLVGLSKRSTRQGLGSL